MLVLSRRPGEEIVIDDNIRVTVVSVKGDRVRIGVSAPEEVQVDRAEVHQRRMAFIDVPVAVAAGVHHDDEVVAIGVCSTTASPDDTMKH